MSGFECMLECKLLGQCIVGDCDDLSEESTRNCHYTCCGGRNPLSL
jgi:hypothetical protein